MSINTNTSINRLFMSLLYGAATAINVGGAPDSVGVSLPKKRAKNRGSSKSRAMQPQTKGQRHKSLRSRSRRNQK